MAMPMVRVRKMGLVVALRFVPVPMAVRAPGRHRFLMLELVMLVVDVLVPVRQRFVPVEVAVPLGQVQPHARRHEPHGR